MCAGRNGGYWVFTLVRAGEHGEKEEFALQKGIAVIGWGELPRLSAIKSREDLARLVKDTYPDQSSKRLINWTGQLWAFRNRIQIDDLVVLPLKRRSAIAIGQVTGPYECRSDGEDGYHARTVKLVQYSLLAEALSPGVTKHAAEKVLDVTERCAAQIFLTSNGRQLLLALEGPELAQRSVSIRFYVTLARPRNLLANFCS